MLPPIIHVGFPKTATTTMRMHVFPALDGISYVGKKSSPAQDFALPDGLGATLAHSHAGDAGRTARARSEALITLRQYAAGPGRILLSYEDVTFNCIGPTFVRRDTGTLLVPFPLRQSLANAVSLLAEAGLPAPRFIFTLREQADLLLSFYAEAATPRRYHACAEAQDFSSFVSMLLTRTEMGLGTLDYTSIEAAATAAGAADVRFVCHEWLRESPALYCEKWAEYLGADRDQVATLLGRARAENVRRQNVPGGAVRMRQRPATLGQLLDDLKARFMPRRSLGIGRAVRRIIGDRALMARELSPDPKDLIRIRKHFRAANLAFVADNPDFTPLLVPTEGAA